MEGHLKNNDSPFYVNKFLFINIFFRTEKITFKDSPSRNMWTFHIILTYFRYVMTCSTPEKVEGVALLQEGCRVVEEKIKSVGGNFAIQMAPKVFLFI